MLSVATGYSPDYLLREVATGRENYYTGAVSEGEPHGRWWGAGASTLGLAGDVDAQDMRAVYERFLDPREDGFADPARWDEVFTLGHPGRNYQAAEQLYAAALEHEPHATAERRDELRVQAGKDARQNVAFLDLTFSVQKSVTMLHTAFEAEEVKARHAGLDDEAGEWTRLRETVETAIWRGNDAALTYMQEHAGYARVGHHGGAAGRWTDAPNWVVASFFQHDSRDHDPQLHIHNATLNRQESTDGVWRTLDSRAIHRLRPAAGAVGERTTNEVLIRDLGAHLAMRPDGAAREATAVTPAERDRFSSRSHKITGRAAELIDQFEASRGRAATGLERDRIKRQATMATRAAKSHQGETRQEFLERVDAGLKAEVAGGLAGIAHAARAQAQGPRQESGRFVASEVIEAALEAAQAKKTSFTHADLVREIDAQLPDCLGLAEGQDVAALLHGLADDAIALVERVEQVDVPAPGEGLEPEALRLRNGPSVFQAPGGRSYVTHEHLRSENRLRAATETRDGAALTHTQAEAFVARLREEGIELGLDQAAALTGVLTSGARLETLIGPAGTGKSFVVGSLARAWSDPAHLPDGAAPRRVFGLATAQVAAEVLAKEGLTATNTARWVATQRRLDTATATGRPAMGGDQGWRLGRGDVLVVDESSMADTADLAVIHAYVEQAGAKMLLVGDPRQLAAVGAGGAMDLVADAGARYELADARRFTHAWERDASLRLRAGDPEIIGEYHRHGRLLDAGTLAEAEASASRAWLADTLGGHRSVLVVDTNEAAARVSSAIRDELVRLGRVEPSGMALRDGTYAGVGDVIQGRRLAWELAGYEGNHRGPVNREHYRVTSVRDDGALEVTVVAPTAAFYPRTGDPAGDATSDSAGGTMVLPPEYVAADTTLAYAVTKHAAEGATVWSGHAVVTPCTDVNGLYVELSRGTEANTAHVATVTGPDDPAQGNAEAFAVQRDPRAVVATILDTREAADQAHRSATAAREDATAWAASVQTAGERFADIAHQVATERTTGWLDQLVAEDVLGPTDRLRIAAEDGAPGLGRVLRQAELAGYDPGQVLRGAIADRPLDGARRVSDVIRGRIEAEHTFDPVGDSWAAWRPRVDDPAWDAYLTALAEAADTRTRELGEQLVKDPPAWALDLFGTVPDDPDARGDWQHRAGLVAGYRELRGHTDGPTSEHRTSGADVLGSAPGRGQVEQHAAYRAAWRAAGLPEYDRDSLELSVSAHRARVHAWEREQAWGPAYVDNMLAGTRQAAEQHQQRAQLRRAEAEATSDPEQRARLEREAHQGEILAAQLAREVAKLEEVSDAHAQWSAETAMTRALADQSRAFLASRNAAADPEPRLTAEEWLAAERAARIEDDPHREITDTDLREEPDNGRRPDEADPAEQAEVEDPEVPTEPETHSGADRRAAPNRSREDQPDHFDDGRNPADHDPAAPADEPARHDRAQQRESDQDAGETEVPDVRDEASGEPRPRDEDTIRAVDDDETDTELDRARRALVEVANRRDLEQQHEQHERDRQLTHWHDEDDQHDTGHDAALDDAANQVAGPAPDAGDDPD